MHLLSNESKDVIRMGNIRAFQKVRISFYLIVIWMTYYNGLNMEIACIL